MLIFHGISNLKFKNSPTIKRERLYSSIYPRNFIKELESNKNLFSIIPMPPNNIPINNSYQKSKKKYNDINFFKTFTIAKENINLDKNLKNQMKIINYLTEYFKTDKEIIPKTIEFNKKSRNKSAFNSNKANYSTNLVNTLSNEPINVDKFIKEINSFLLPNDKTFESIQNLINNKIKLNKETRKTEVPSQILKTKEIPIDTFNYELIFIYVFNNTFVESLKKTLSNKTLINKSGIKEEYHKQINNIKHKLNLHNKEIEDIPNNQKSEPLIVNKNSSAISSCLNRDKSDSNRINKKINLKMYNKQNIQTNSSDNIFLNHKKNDKELIFLKNVKTNSKRYTSYENFIRGVVKKTKMVNVKESKFKNIIRKQKNIIDNYKKLLKEKIKNDKDKLIKTENSFQNNNKVFVFLSNKKDTNKNEDIINYINNNESNIKYENLKKTIFKISSSKKLLFDENIFNCKNIFNENGKNKEQQNNKLIKENNSKFSNTCKEPIKKYVKRKKNKGIKIFLKKKKALNIKNLNYYLQEEK